MYIDYLGRDCICLYKRVNTIRHECSDDIVDASLIEHIHNKDIPPDHPDYKPPKGGDRKVRNPNGKGKGWLARDGGVWIWTPGMHGGDGWTIEYPGGGHSHAYPGGGTRNHFERETPEWQSAVSICVGVVAVVVLVADDFTGIGCVDEPLIPVGLGCIAIGIDGLTKKKCTECGEVIYE